MPVFDLMPLHCGICRLGENHLLGDPYSDDNRVDFALYAFLADGGPGRRVLIDLGPIGLPYLNQMFRRYNFFRDVPEAPDDIVQPYGNLFEWITRLGLKPEDINHVVLTHVHADHHGLDDARDAGAILQLPNAVLHTSRIGWEWNLARRVGGQWNSYVDYAFADYLLEGEKKGRVVFHDDDEVIPGIDVIYLGGHSVCSQAVRVQTATAPAIITSDEIYRYDLLEKGIMGRLRTSDEAQQAATEKLVQLALEGAILLPCHEPIMATLYDQHHHQWLQAVKAVSDKAAQGFANSPKQLIG